MLLMLEWDAHSSKANALKRYLLFGRKTCNSYCLRRSTPPIQLPSEVTDPRHAKEHSKGHSSRRPLWHLAHLVQGVSLPTSACREEIRDEKYYYCKISTCRPGLITEDRAKWVIIAKNDLGLSLPQSYIFSTRW